MRGPQYRLAHATALNDDFVPMGMAKDKTDQIIYDIHLGHSASGFGHPTCAKDESKIAENLPSTQHLKK